MVPIFYSIVSVVRKLLIYLSGINSLGLGKNSGSVWILLMLEIITEFSELCNRLSRPIIVSTTYQDNGIYINLLSSSAPRSLSKGKLGLCLIHSFITEIR